MTKKLWEASLNRKKNSTLFAFENYISKKFNKNFNNKFEKLLDWTIKNSPDFWSSFWDFSLLDGAGGSVRRQSKKAGPSDVCPIKSRRGRANSVKSSQTKKIHA